MPFVIRRIVPLCLWLAAAVPLQAQPSLVTAEVARQTPPVRSAAPAMVLWRLRSQATSPLEGRLELTVRDDDRVVGQLVTEPLVLTVGESLHRTILPPLSGSGRFRNVEIDAKFLTPKGPLDLKRHDILVLPPTERSFVIALCDPRQTDLRPESARLVDALQFERSREVEDDRSIRTRVMPLRPDECSSDPLLWCSFDLVVVFAEGFSELKEGQLLALDRWVQAGGSLWLATAGSTPGRPHLGFLGALCGAQAADDLFPLDSHGRLNLMPEAANGDSAATESIILKRRGLGRVAILRPPLTALNTPEGEMQLRRVTAFLWKMRRDRVASFLESGRWSAAPDTTAASFTGPDDPRQYMSPQQRALMAHQLAQLRPSDARLAPVPIQSVDHLLDRLMPKGLKILPLPLVGLLLVLYVAAIGPGDYLLLGALRRRKWTWLLFPATTLAFAVATVGLANWYMRVSEVPRHVTICDLGDNNAVARTNRFETLFRGSPAAVGSDMSRAYFTAMNLQRFSSATAFMYQQAQVTGARAQFDLIGAARYEGRLPTQYTVTQYLPQWTPQLNRVFSLSRPDEATDFNWAAFADPAVFNPRSLVPGAPAVSGGESASQKLRAQLREAFGPQISVFVATGSQLFTITGDSNVLRSTNQTGYMQNPNRYPGYYVPQVTAATFLSDICANSTLGLFGVISQLSPTGGDDFEDLSLIDPSDPDQWLLVVVVPQGDDLVVYRKLYTGGP